MKYRRSWGKHAATKRVTWRYVYPNGSVLQIRRARNVRISTRYVVWGRETEVAW